MPQQSQHLLCNRPLRPINRQASRTWTHGAPVMLGPRQNLPPPHQHPNHNPLRRFKRHQFPCQVTFPPGAALPRLQMPYRQITAAASAETSMQLQRLRRMRTLVDGVALRLPRLLLATHNPHKASRLVVAVASVAVKIFFQMCGSRIELGAYLDMIGMRICEW